MSPVPSRSHSEETPRAAMNACGFEFDTVHQALNHARRGADRVTGIYVERDFTKAWEANRKVLDLLK